VLDSRRDGTSALITRLSSIPTVLHIQTGLGNVTKNGSLNSAATQLFYTPATPCSPQRYILSPVHTGDIASEIPIAAEPDARNGGFDLDRLPPVVPGYTPTTPLQIKLANLTQEARQYKADRDLQIAKRVHAMVHFRAEFNLLAQDEKRCKVAKRVHATMHIHAELDVLAQEEKRCKADCDLQVAKRVHTTMHFNAESSLLAQAERRFQVAKRVHSMMHSHNGIGKNTGSDPTPFSPFLLFFPIFLLALGLCDIFRFFPILSLLCLLPQPPHSDIDPIDLTLTCRAISTKLQYIILLPKQTKKIVSHAQIYQNRRIGIEQIFNIYLYTYIKFAKRIPIMQA
jgi:hypothetical protein